MKTPVTFSWLGAVARSLGSLALVASIGGGSPAQAQIPVFRAAATLESYVTNNDAYRPSNTGCGRSSDGNDILDVLIWDGQKPSFGWTFNGAAKGHQPLEITNAGFICTDPDIVSTYANGKYFMAAVYVVDLGAGNVVAYEEQVYDQSTNTWIVLTPHKQLSSGSTPADSPNIDVDRSGDAVMVFEEGGAIYAETLNLPSTSLGTLGLVNDISPTLAHRQPDVAIYEDAGGSQPIIVSVTYISRNRTSGALLVNLSQDELPNVQLGPGPFPAPLTTFGAVAVGSILELPRIAAPQFGGRYDCMTAVRYRNSAPNSGDEIRTLTILNGSLQSTQVVNAPLTSSKPGNYRPVVTYAGDGALIAWQFDFGTGGPTPKLDVVGIWVTLNGVRGSSFGGDLLVANQQTNGNQYIPSLEAHGGTNISVGTAMWYDDKSDDIAYKPIQWYSAQLRPANASGVPLGQPADEKQLSIYPNPVTDGAHVALRLAPGEAVKTFQVLETRTGKVVATLPLTGLQAGSNDVLLPTLPAGLYLLRVQTDQGPRLTRFSYQP